MTLDYLDFDYSEDDEGTGTFDAMACVTEAQWARLQHEITQVLQWCHEQFPEGPSPLEDGGDWQYDLQAVQEVSTPVALHFDPATGGIARKLETAAPPRLTVTLTLSGHAQFCEALRAEFGLE